jgi:hypothetical protein
VPGWLGARDAASILLQQVGLVTDGTAICKIDFLARDLARPFLHSGAPVLVMEGPTIVARATILESLSAPARPL